MTTLKDGTFRYSTDDKPWLTFDASTGDSMKVLHVDPAMRQVVFIQRFGRNTTHPPHTHHGSAVAYTLCGTWQYDGEPFPAGTVAFEPVKSRHTPMTRDGDVADVLVILTADNDEGRLLELDMPDGTTFHFTLDLFRLMAGMKGQEELDALLAQLQAETPDN